MRVRNEITTKNGKKNFSLTDRIGGSIMYENDNFSGYETGNENTTGTFSGADLNETRTPKSMEVISGKLW